MMQKDEPLPNKKVKKSTGKVEKLQEKYFCLKFLEVRLQGKREERFTSVCRMDASSINRHKKRWHNLPNTTASTFVPSTAPEVQALRQKYEKRQDSPKHTPATANTDEISSNSSEATATKEVRESLSASQDFPNEMKVDDNQE